MIHDPQTMLFAWAQGEEEGMMVSEDVVVIWTKSYDPPKQFYHKRKLFYVKTGVMKESDPTNSFFYKMTDGSVIREYDRVSAYETDYTGRYFEIVLPGEKEPIAFYLSDYTDECLSCDLNYIAEEVTKLAGKTIGRYVLPIEDAYILLEGADFDGVQSNRAVAGGFILIEFVPGGKILKPVTKGLKAGTKATIKGTRKLYKLAKASKVVVGELADDILKPAKWIDGEVDEVLETLSDVTYVGKDGKQAKGTVQVVKQGSEVGFKKVISTLDEFWAQIPTPYLEGIKKAFNGTPVLKYADEDMVFYRRWGGDAKEVGSWLSPTKYEKAGNARRYLALPDGNTAENITAFKIKKGTPYIDGKAASQINDVTGIFGTYAEGGGNQIYILYEDWNKLIKQ